jgi:hypothetical protein
MYLHHWLLASAAGGHNIGANHAIPAGLPQPSRRVARPSLEWLP